VEWPGPVAKLGGDDRAPLFSPALPLIASYEAFDLVCVGLSQLLHGTDINDRKLRRRVTVILRDEKTSNSLRRASQVLCVSRPRAAQKLRTTIIRLSKVCAPCRWVAAKSAFRSAGTLSAYGPDALSRNRPVRLRTLKMHNTMPANR